MPGYLAILIREIQGKQVEIGRCLSSFGMKLRKRLGGLAEYTIQRKYVNRLFYPDMLSGKAPSPYLHVRRMLRQVWLRIPPPSVFPYYMEWA